MKLILVKHTYLYICPVVVGIMIKKQDQVSDVITFNFNIKINVFIEVLIHITLLTCYSVRCVYIKQDNYKVRHHTYTL